VRRRHGNRIGVLVASAVTAVLVAGCGGVSTQGTPRAIQPSDVPFGLLQTNRPTPAPTLPGATEDLVVYFAGPNGLSSVVREQRGAATATDAVDGLTAGPTDEEARAGLHSALVRRTVDGVRVASGVATVDLDSEFLQLGRSEQAFAIAQLVFTLTELDNVERVRLRVGGESLPVATVSGRATTAPIGRNQVVIPDSQ
jgi:germination protein M